MSDFDSTQLETDLSSICSVTYSGEAFTVGGTTYYGVFNETDRMYEFQPLGNADDKKVNLVINRGAGWTPTMNALLFRSFDSATYRVTDINQDSQAFTMEVVTPRAN